jgi:hypothetical protein
MPHGRGAIDKKITLPPLGKPGGLDDPLRKGLSGCKVRWYLRNLAAGMSPEEARKKAAEGREKPQPQPQAEKRMATPPQEPSSKRMKTGARIPARTESELKRNSYAAALSVFKVAILPEEYPSGTLSSEDQSKLGDLIMGEVAPAYEGMGLSLQFVGIRFRPSIVIIECATKQTAEWLISRTPNLKGWDGIKLRACSEEDIPRARTVTTYFPRSRETKEEDILRLLRAQNMGLNTTLWRVLNTKAEGTGKLLTLSIDESSCGEIERGGHSLFYRYGKIPIHGLRKKAAHEGEGKQSMPSGSSKDTSEPGASSAEEASGEEITAVANDDPMESPEPQAVLKEGTMPCIEEGMEVEAERENP